MFKNFFKGNKDIKRDLKELNTSFDGLVNVLDNMNKTPSGKQSKTDLLNFPLLVWVQLNSKIRIKRKNNRFNDLLVFETEMKKGASFFEHFHSDIVESTEIVYGEVKDLVTGKVYKKNAIMHYDKMKVHTILALDETKLNVIFRT